MRSLLCRNSAKFVFYFVSSAVVNCKNRKNLFYTTKTLAWSFGSLRDYIPFPRTQKEEDTYKRIDNIIQKADSLFEKGQFSEVYDLLVQYKSTGIESQSHGEILWRICKSLYNLSSDKSLPKEMRGEMINEAHNLITIAYMNEENNAEINKWMSIILEAKCDLEGLKYKVENLSVIKKHLMRSYELNPQDYSVLYMLGQWCYSMASLSWFQRQIASLWYGPVPQSTYEESFEYFSKAEELKPRHFIPNTYMLGKVSLCLNRNFTGTYYLNVAANLKPRNSVELEYQISARNLLTELEYFDLCKYAIFTDFLDI